MSKYVQSQSKQELEEPLSDKLLLRGKVSLTNAELLTMLINPGDKRKEVLEPSINILSFCRNNLREFAKISMHELTMVKGIGKAKATTILAAIEIGRRIRQTNALVLEKICSSRDAYEYIRGNVEDLRHEEAGVLSLNRANRILSNKIVGRGGPSGTVIDPKMVFKTALDNHAVSVIVYHNHPSGNISPSESDIKLTKKLVEAGKLIDIQVLDHLIIGDNRYYSFADDKII